MKALTKATALLVACILLSAIAVSSLVAYGVITLTSNPETFSTASAGTLALALNSSSPFIGDTLKLTATLSHPQTGATVYFVFNGTFQAGSATTNANGVAVLNYAINSVYTTTVATAVTTITPT